MALGMIGIPAQVVALWQVRDMQCNVTTYAIEVARVPFYLPPSLLAAVTVLLTVGIAAWIGFRREGHRSRFPATCWPLVGCAPLALWPAFSSTPPAFVLVLLFVMSSGFVFLVAAQRCDTGLVVASDRSGTPKHSGHHVVLSVVWALIIVLVVIHTSIQLDHYDHFRMGHADVGHFVEELKNCLWGRGLRSDSFDNIRLGWHFTPLLYVLVPLFAIWPSLTLLMACGALFVHLPALFIYSAVRRRTNDVTTALIFALAWLALPSLGRMIYSNTYGFQWDYATIPLMAASLWAFSLNRWKTAYAFLACTALCVETASAAVMGVGLSFILTRRCRMTGLGIALGALVYAILCTRVFIPHFALSGRYERADLFGALGPDILNVLLSPIRHPSIFWQRLTRLQDLGYIAMLLVPMCGLPILGWRVAVAALPTLSLVLLLDNSQFLSIKFWHQAPLLPILFFACISLLRCPAKLAGAKEDISPLRLTSRSDGLASDIRGRNRSIAFAILITSLWSHYFFGFSPVSKFFEVQAADAAMHTADPRLPFIERMRSEIGRDHSILATERLAAHFWDYRRVYTGRRIRAADYVILDRSDNWDMSGLPAKSNEYASDSNYRVREESGPIIVFERIEQLPDED